MPINIFSNVGMDQIEPEMQDFFEKIMPSKKNNRRMKISNARNIIYQQELEKLIDKEKMIETAIGRTEQLGLVFLDEIDKVCSGESVGPDVSREGVQRDLLPMVEGCAVNTRHGIVKTDHILFIAAGAFSRNKPSDLMPELQGRFPIRVELNSLTENDFVEILIQPRNALIKQYIALLKTEGIHLVFDKAAIDEIARIAYMVNNETENIGARRLHTIMEKLLEDISFNAPEMDKKKITITQEYVKKRLKNIAGDKDLSRYIL